MTKSFESYLMSKFREKHPDIRDHKPHLNVFVIGLGSDLICQYVDEWAKESATVKALDVQWPEESEQWQGGEVTAQEVIAANAMRRRCIKAFNDAKFGTPPPIEPAKARKALDCLTQKDEQIARMREALEQARAILEEDGYIYGDGRVLTVIKQALQPPQETNADQPLNGNEEK